VSAHISALRSRAAELLNDERGSEVVEYALLLGMIACACLVLIAALGNKVVQRWTRINEIFPDA
jgi:Flp pilus assembly pilin Flp